MQDAAIYETLSEILNEIFMRDDLVARPDLTAKDVEGWDSFKMIEILMATEERFGVKLSTREIDNLKSVGDLARAIAGKIKA